MHDPALVGGGETAADLRGVRETLSERERSGGEAFPQRFPLEKFAHEVGRTVMTTDVMDRQEVRVVEAAEGARLPLEALQPLGVGGEVGREDLDRHVPREFRIPRAIHLAHGTGARQRDDLKASESFSGWQSH
jgi:hypothetical protein